MAILLFLSVLLNIILSILPISILYVLKQNKIKFSDIQKISQQYYSFKRGTKEEDIKTFSFEEEEDFKKFIGEKNAN